MSHHFEFSVVFAVVICHGNSLGLIGLNFYWFDFNRSLGFAIACQQWAITWVAAAATEL